jgi:5-phospho-D-xylono-1,4-lactonase
VNIVAATGLHHERFYDRSGWTEQVTTDELAALFIADIQEGIDEGDHRAASVRRSSVRAGVIKVAGSEGGPSGRDSRAFAAAAEAHLRTGVPILTHCENGTGAIEQVELLTDLGVRARHITLSHVDKVVDREYHREIVSTGAFLEYDQAFRWGDAANGTARLLRWTVDDHRADHVVVGNDAARQQYYRAYGGQPGLAWLLDIVGHLGIPAVPGLERQLFIDNPARAFAFAEVGT